MNPMDQICRGLVAGLSALLLSACSDNLSPTSSFEVAVKGAQAAAISNDGLHTVIGSVHHGGSLWRNRDGERLYNWNHKTDDYTTVVAAAFSPDSRWAITANPHTMVLWDMRDGSAQRYWTAPGTILDIALSNDGRFALLGLDDQSAVLFDVQRGGIRRTFHHKNRVRAVDLSEDGRIAITGSEDTTATVWDVQSGKALQRIQHDDDVQMVAISPDGILAMSASQYDKALLWDTRTGKALGRIPLAAEQLKRGIRFTSAKFSSDGRQLLTGRPDQLVQLWDTRAIKELARWELPKRDAWKPTGAAVVSVGFQENRGRYLAVASNGFVHRLTAPQ
ncbi:WD40 repeat domain-containing protein [Candidatus Pelagadaptatus aseana]|uniref:WD40 repeat domain-containing protein n=1 Tax=Candidatus Pelagadaptatus aseana TaxID=3120508 RepID=UPI003C6F7B5E